MVAEITTQEARRRRLSPSLVADRARRPRLVLLVVTGLSLVAMACVIAFPGRLSHSVFVPILVGAGIFLSGRFLVRAVAVVVLTYAIAAVSTWRGDGVHTSVLVVMLTVFTILVAVSRRRSWGPVALAEGPGLLADLRTRLDRQGHIPELGEGYDIEACVLPVGGDAFSGDFVVSGRRGSDVEVALTDVSGHGHGAAMRALLLSGALAGLIGEVPFESFLPAANRYLIRQGWRDGFASCIHVRLDLTTGEYAVGTAGHPSAAHFRAATQEWEMVTGAAGLLLGLFDLTPDDYACAVGQMEPGDFLLLYTDGMVEGSDGDVVEGTRRMLDHARTAIESGVTGAARRICLGAAGRGDDRSAVLLHRSVPAADDALT